MKVLEQIGFIRNLPFSPLPFYFLQNENFSSKTPISCSLKWFDSPRFFEIAVRR
jgi:hypothetical protein